MRFSWMVAIIVSNHGATYIIQSAYRNHVALNNPNDLDRTLLNFLWLNYNLLKKSFECREQ